MCLQALQQKNVSAKACRLLPTSDKAHVAKVEIRQGRVVQPGSVDLYISSTFLPLQRLTHFGIESVAWTDTIHTIQSP